MILTMDVNDYFQSSHEIGPVGYVCLCFIGIVLIGAVVIAVSKLIS